MVHYTKQKSKDLATQPTKNSGAFGCFETVFSSCSTSGTYSFYVVKNPVSHERGNRTELKKTANGTNM